LFFFLLIKDKSKNFNKESVFLKKFHLKKKNSFDSFLKITASLNEDGANADHVLGGKNGENGNKVMIGDNFIEGTYGGLGWKHLGFLFLLLFFFFILF
jgi:hypothetical protein